MSRCLCHTASVRSERGICPPRRDDKCRSEELSHPGLHRNTAFGLDRDYCSRRCNCRLTKATEEEADACQRFHCSWFSVTDVVVIPRNRVLSLLLNTFKGGRRYMSSR